jgi:hypothetical protein
MENDSLKEKNKSKDKNTSETNYLETVSRVDFTKLDNVDRTINQIEVREVFFETYFKPFIDSLNENSIFTISQLQGISIYAYLNQNDIFIGNERNTLLSRIVERLESMYLSINQTKESGVIYADEEIKVESIMNIKPNSEQEQTDEENYLIENLDLIYIISEYLKQKGTQPVKVEDIRTDLKFGRRTVIGGLLSTMSWAVEINYKSFIHRDSISDMYNAAETFLKALQKLFIKNSGYASKKQLYDVVRTDLDLFMFVNGIDNAEKIYFIAKHLFEKEKYKGNKFIFFNNTHIWEKEPNYPKNLTGLLIKLTRENGGIITKEMSEEYLERIGVASVNVPAAMRIWQDSIFWQLDRERYILSEMMCIDEHFEQLLGNSLNALLSKSEYVIIRDIAEYWFDMLPALPKCEKWTPLLLQEAIKNINIGYRTIPAGLGQNIDTVHAAVTKEDSGFNTFADVVWDYINKTLGTPIQLETEQLRKLLIEAGMLKGNERLFTMHKALEDYRFIWLDENQMVKVTKG